MRIEDEALMVFFKLVAPLGAVDTFRLNFLNLKAMNVQIQSVKFDASKQLLEFIQKKMDRLDRFVDERAGDVEVVLRLDPDSEKGNKVVVISLHVPGSDIRVEERAFTFEEAIDNSMDIIKRQLEKAKAKFEK